MMRKREVYCMIYLSHCLSAWGDRMWDFAVGLYMIILYPNSLLLTAILGFATASAVISLGSLLGSWIDRTKRIASASIAIIVQNLTIAVAATGLALTFAYKDEIQTLWNGALEPTIFALVILASVISKLASVASDIAIERDWVVVLTQGDEQNLATMNSIMRTIDLTTKILAPVAIGVLISYWSQMASAIFVAAWNIVSGFVEVYLLLSIYKQVPALAHKGFQRDENRPKGTLKDLWRGWGEYFRHPVKLAGIAFACLYMTVLGFDQITVGYLYSQGVNESFIGISTAFGAIVGIVGSVSYPFLRRGLGKNATAILGYILNSSCLLICAVSVFLPDSPFEPSSIFHPYDTSTTTSTNSLLSLQELWTQRQNVFFFIGGIVSARFGLWVADLSTAQLLQDTVEEAKRGVINGIQNSMNQLMDMIKFLLVILLPSTRTFGYLVISTWVFSCLSCSLYSVFSLRNSQRGRPWGNIRGDEGNSNGKRSSARQHLFVGTDDEEGTAIGGPSVEVHEETPLLPRT